MTPESKPQGSEQPGRPHPSRNFEEDFQHENGNYLNVCSDCGKQFLGYKRRVTCKLCSLPNPSADEEVERLTEPKSEDVRKWLEFYWQEGFRLGTTNEGAKSTVVALLRELIALSAKHKEEREQWDRTRRIIDAEVEKAKASYEKELSQLRASLADTKKQRDDAIEDSQRRLSFLEERNLQFSALQSELATAQAEKHGLEDVVLATRNMSIEAFDRIRALIGASPNDPRPCETLVSELIESLRSHLQTAMEERDATAKEAIKKLIDVKVLLSGEPKLPIHAIDIINDLMTRLSTSRSTGRKDNTL